MESNTNNIEPKQNIEELVDEAKNENFTEGTNHEETIEKDKELEKIKIINQFLEDSIKTIFEKNPESISNTYSDLYKAILEIVYKKQMIVNFLNDIQLRNANKELSEGDPDYIIIERLKSYVGKLEDLKQKYEVKTRFIEDLIFDIIREDYKKVREVLLNDRH